MKILWFTWKDMTHPLAGGAEVVNEKIAQRAVQDGHQVTFIVGGYSNAKREETRDGFTIIRVGNRLSLYWKAYQLYKRDWQGWADVVIEEINTIPFMTRWYVQERKVLFIYQLCRQIWFYQIGFPFHIIGYLLEPIYLFLLRMMPVITESKSTQDELCEFGFKKSNIKIIPMASEIKPLSQPVVSPEGKFIILSLGSVRPMKRTLDQVKAFEKVYDKDASSQFIIAGDMSGPYGEKVRAYIAHSPAQKNITIQGKVNTEEKRKLMKDAHVIVVTSVKEGWGLIVTEAASQGTPAVVYNVDGLRDSVQHQKTGLVVEPSPEALSRGILQLMKDRTEYSRYSKQAWKHASNVSFEDTYQEFLQGIQ